MWGKSAGMLWGVFLTAKERGRRGEGLCVFSAYGSWRGTGEGQHHGNLLASGQKTKPAGGKGTEAKPRVPP